MYRKMLYLLLAIVFGLTLSAQAANIVWVSENLDEKGDGILDDQKWIDLLESEGHNVFTNPGAWATLEPNEIDILNNADLVIISRATNSGGYATDAAEVTQWNSITAPMILMNSYFTRSNRWLWINSTTLPGGGTTPATVLLEAVDLKHPIFAGVTLDANNRVQIYDPNADSGNISIIGVTDVGNGALVAKGADQDWTLIAEWEKGVETYSGSGQFLGGKRLLFNAGAQAATAGYGGVYDLTDTGLKMFINAVNYLIAVPPRVNAYLPNPADGKIDVPRENLILSWKAGIYAVKHDVYFGTALNSVRQASRTNTMNVLVSQDQDNAAYSFTSTLEYGQTYYWRIDEVGADSKVYKGDIWSFTAANFNVMDDFEAYNDANNMIFNAWADYFVNNTGMTVGHFDPPFAESTTVHSGSQAMYMRYDNDGTVNEGTIYEKAGTLLYSEAEREWMDAQNWTVNGVQSLTIWFRGYSVSVGSFKATATGYTMTASGADIWSTSDQFHYAYKMLSGLGSITARVLSVTNTDPSAKAGVMIRESLAANAKHAMVVVQPGAGTAFQRRPNEGASSEQVAVQATALAPQWVRLTRSGNIFTAEYSANGTAWTTLGSIEMPMLADVYIGLCLTSHNVNATCTAEFSNVSPSGGISGQWQSQDIGIQSNIPEGLYLVVSDSAGNSAVVKHPNPGSSAIPTWTEWNVPLANFTGVNMQAVKKLAIGVGDRANPISGGAGTLYIDDIRLYLPPRTQ